MAEKRKLPVLNQRAAEPPEPERPPWHWVGFGAVLVFAAWLPLAWLAEAFKSRIVLRLLGPVSSEEDVRTAMAALHGSSRVVFAVATIGLPALAMAVGAGAAGYVVGRFGGTTSAREAGLGGVVAGAIACVLAWITAGFQPAVVVVVPVLGGAAWFFGGRGVRARARVRAS